MIGLLVKTPELSCPECKMQLEIVTSTPERVVLKHNEHNPYRECQFAKKLFTVKPQFVQADEI